MFNKTCIVCNANFQWYHNNSKTCSENCRLEFRRANTYNRKLLEPIVADSRSIAGALALLGLAPRGSNYHTLKKHLQRLNIDTSHWTGQGWSKTEQLKTGPIMQLRDHVGRYS